MWTTRMAFIIIPIIITNVLAIYNAYEASKFWNIRNNTEIYKTFSNVYYLYNASRAFF